jgi:crotonobetainyl-CoA:carnitine CoA-transferase CaiB-like acyl-CoA transferase
MRPLEGIRILDLTRVVSGPYCTMLLGDLGAEVIKVERPRQGDDTRAFAPPFQGDQAAYFLSINRNKKSITLDMKSERGKEVLWRLVDVSDVLAENFRQGVLAALYAAKVDGQGQRVHVSMYEAVAALLTFNASIYFATGTSPRRRGNEHATIVPYETFEVSDGWINIGVANDDLWRRLCGAAGMRGLTDDPRFATAPDRVRNRDVLVPLVKAVIKQRSRNDWLKRFDDSGVPCGAIRTVAEVCDGEILEARGMIAEMPHPSAGNVKGIKSAIHLSETALDTYNAPPKLGEHTHEVLTKLLGYTREDVLMLARGGVI